MRIMTAADKVESAVLDHLNVTNQSRIADGIAPAGVILMGVYAVEPDVFAIQEKALIGCPFAPAKAQCSSERSRPASLHCRLG